MGLFSTSVSSFPTTYLSSLTTTTLLSTLYSLQSSRQTTLIAMSDSKDTDGKAPQAPSADTTGEASASKPTAAKIDPKMAETLLELNPALKNELGGTDKSKAAEVLQKMDIADLLTGLSVGGKNTKDMASYKFWQTQPVPRFDETASKDITEGPIKRIDPEKVSKEPDPLIEGFEWTTLDLTNKEELHELWDLLTNHYVEDDNAMFRFRYSESFLHWYVEGKCVVLDDGCQAC